MKFIYFLLIALTSLLYSCASNGSKFYVTNYEKDTVLVSYTYHEKGEFVDTLGSDRPPSKYVQIANQILDEKVLKNYPFKNTKKYFDSLEVERVDSLSFQFYLPPNSTVLIPPIHNYGANIKHLIINNQLVLFFSSPLYEEFISEGLYVDKFSLFGKSYFLVNLKLNELSKVSFNEFMKTN